MKRPAKVWVVWFDPKDCPEVMGIHGIYLSLSGAVAGRRQLNRENGWGIQDMPIRQYPVGEKF
jgi:hypothetical protein